MRIRLLRYVIMKYKEQREVLSKKAEFEYESMCAPPNSNMISEAACRNERTSLWILARGSLTIEAALVLPFFLSILLAFFIFFDRYALAARLSVEAASEAKKLGIVLGCMQTEETGDVTIYRSENPEVFWQLPFEGEKAVVQKAVCRAWIGFTELDTEETYVYITPGGSVYHLYSDCTHLKLSIQSVTLAKALRSRNENGERYRKCQSCKEPPGIIVYITSEGSRYHSERSCSGLKRTIRRIPLSEAEGRGCCLRCMEREE